MPSATCLGVPNRLASTGMECPVGAWNSKAGPPERRTAVRELGHFKNGRNRLADTAQLAECFEAGGEVARVFVFHRLKRREKGPAGKAVCARGRQRLT